MNLLDEHLMALFQKGIVGYEAAVSKAQNIVDFEAQARETGHEDVPAPQN